MYFEQCYVTKGSGTKQGFVNAVAMFKMTAINMNVREMMWCHFGIKKLVVDDQVIYIIGELGIDIIQLKSLLAGNITILSQLYIQISERRRSSVIYSNARAIIISAEGVGNHGSSSNYQI